MPIVQGFNSVNQAAKPPAHRIYHDNDFDSPQRRASMPGVLWLSAGRIERHGQ